MRAAELFRSTAFRLAALFAGLFVTGFLAAAAAIYVQAVGETEQRMDDLVTETRQALLEGYRKEGLGDLVTGVERHVRAAEGDDRVYLLLAPDGRRLAGNLPETARFEGSGEVPGGQLGLDADDSYRIVGGKVGDLYLLVGASLSTVRELAQTLLVAFGWGTLAVTGIALGGGLLLGLRAQRRIDAIALALDRAAAGDLETRVPRQRSGDDIDQVAGRINAALERMQNLLETLKQVSTDIAHDLKTPISRLQITIEQARKAAAAGEPVEMLLHQADAETRTVNATFEALLGIAQIESGRRRDRFVEVDIEEILTSLTDTYGAVAEDACHELILELPPGSSRTLLGDRELLTQMFANLIENAIRHCRSPARITVGARGGEEGAIVAYVRDTGPGIPAAERDKVFRRLYRLEKSRTTKGSGLGLSIVRAVADLHHATVTLGDNAPGLLVEVTFPATATAA
jgi:signal transduction histidine kinase